MSSLSNMSSICASTLFSKILDLLHYHYSEFFFNTDTLPVSTHLAVLLGFYLVPSSGTYYSAVSFHLTFCLQSLFHRLQDCISSCFLCLLPVGEADLRVFCRLPGGMGSCLPIGMELGRVPLMGRAVLRSSFRGGCGLRNILGSLFSDGWGCGAALLVAGLRHSSNEDIFCRQILQSKWQPPGESTLMNIP